MASSAELTALFSSIEHQLTISGTDLESVLVKMNGAKLTVAALSDDSMNHKTLRIYGIEKIEDANIIVAAAKAFVGKSQGDSVATRRTLWALGQSGDSFDKITGNEPLDIRLLSILLTSVNNWENLGVKLGIPLHRIEEIKINCSGDLDKCKNKLYDVWLRLNTNPTWNEIVSALEQMEENYLADKIRQRFLQPHNDNFEMPSLMKQISLSVYDSPVLGSEHGHDPISNVMVPVAAVPLSAIVSPHTATPLFPLPATSVSTAMPSGRTILPSSNLPQTTAMLVAFPQPHGDTTPGASSTSATQDSQLADLLRSMTIEDPQQIEISCKVYNADTRKLIESTKPQAPLTRDIALKRHNRDRIHEFSSNAVPIGTSIRLEITTNSECYLYVLNIGTSGKITILLPNEFDDNYFLPNQAYHLPDPELGFDITGPSGKETLQFLAFSSKQSLLEKLSNKPIQEEELLRNIVIKRRMPSVPNERKGFTQVQFHVHT